MKRFGSLVFLVLCLAFNAHAQERIISPALDPDYVILKADTAFYGYYANQGLGFVLKSYPPLIDPKDYGIVFINNLDTAGYAAQGGNSVDSIGLFRTGPNLFRPAKAVLKTNGNDAPVPVFSRGRYDEPSWCLLAGAFKFAESTAGLPRAVANGIFFARPTGFSVGGQAFAHYFDSDSLEDLLITQAEADSTWLLLWQASDLVYKGDTLHTGNGTRKIIRPTIGYNIAGLIEASVHLTDLNLDGIPDLIFLGAEEEGHGLPRHFGVVLGGRDGSGLWNVQSHSLILPRLQINAVSTFDFLRNDGIPEIIIGTSDTIYVYDGARKKLFASAGDFEDADLKLPSPGKLDPVNFYRNGEGGISDFGKYLFNAGKFAGGTIPYLASQFLYYPFSGSLYAEAYTFFYAGGVAADERADALFMDRSEPQSQEFTRLDTVRTSSTGPSGVLIGDQAYSMGGTGALWHIKGRADIPHSTDPRWKEAAQSPLLEIGLQLIHVDRREVTLSVPMHTTYGYIDALDMLGRTVATDRLPPYVTHYVMHLPDVSSGVYQLVYRDFHGNLLARPSKLEVLR